MGLFYKIFYLRPPYICFLFFGTLGGFFESDFWFLKICDKMEEDSLLYYIGLYLALLSYEYYLKEFEIWSIQPSSLYLLLSVLRKYTYLHFNHRELIFLENNVAPCYNVETVDWRVILQDYILHFTYYIQYNTGVVPSSVLRPAVPSRILHPTCSAYISLNNGRILMFKVSKRPCRSPLHDRIICKWRQCLLGGQKWN